MRVRKRNVKLLKVVFWGSLFLSLVIPLTTPWITRSVEQGVIDATVKISICGDGFAEGKDEQCDGDDLKGSTCADIGYDEGDLYCDIACDYVETNCVKHPPPPAPPEEVPTDPPPSQIVYPKKEPLPYDLDADGRITLVEMVRSVGFWVKDLRSGEAGKCDLNKDRFCNIIDFSILMYYIDNEGATNNFR